MPETLNLNYYYGNEADQYSFYRIPKILLTDRCYKGVSLEAKVLYGLLLDRMGLSARNGWLDDNGRVFLYFTQEEAMTMLDCGKDKATKLFRELEGTDLVKRIGNTTFDIHIHFSETSRETFTDKVVRLIENDKDSVIYV